MLVNLIFFISSVLLDVLMVENKIHFRLYHCFLTTANITACGGGGDDADSGDNDAGAITSPECSTRG